jgi:hypothetical protein
MGVHDIIQDIFDSVSYQRKYTKEEIDRFRRLDKEESIKKTIIVSSLLIGSGIAYYLSKKERVCSGQIDFVKGSILKFKNSENLYKLPKVASDIFALSTLKQQNITIKCHGLGLFGKFRIDSIEKS